jgi:hypothetical protein
MLEWNVHFFQVRQDIHTGLDGFLETRRLQQVASTALPNNAVSKVASLPT